MRDLSYQGLRSVFLNESAPFAFLFLEPFNRNIQLAKKRSGSKGIRVASKSVRSISALKHIQSSLGEKFTGLMTYHLDESLYLLSCGFNSTLMGYPQLMSQDQAHEVKRHGQEGRHLISMVDSVEQVEKLNIVGKEVDYKLKVCIDIDLSLSIPGLNFGVFRSPLKELEQNKVLFEKIAQCKYIECIGIMGYEAQIAGVGDKLGKGFLFDKIVAFLKSLSTKRIYKYRNSVVQLAKSYFELEFVNGGGTGSLSMTAKDLSVTEVTAGSAFYCPHLFDRYEEAFEPSCGYAVQICRKPNDNMVTCHGGGYVASGAFGVDKIPTVFSPSELKFDKNEMFGEVQTPLHKTSDVSLELGDPVFLRHAKAGELMERFEDIIIVKDNQIEQRWKTYRGDGLCYL